MDTPNSSCHTYAPTDFSKYFNFRLETILALLDSLIYLSEPLPDNLKLVLLGKAIRALLLVMFFDFHTYWIKKKKMLKFTSTFSHFTNV